MYFTLDSKTGQKFEGYSSAHFEAQKISDRENRPVKLFCHVYMGPGNFAHTVNGWHCAADKTVFPN